MFYIFYGTDTETSREKARALVTRLRRGGGFFERMTADTFDPEALAARVKETGLFSGDAVTVLDGAFAYSGAEEILADMAKDIALSPNAFVLIEQKISKKCIDACEGAGANIVVSDEKKKGRGWEEKTVFSFADAYAKGDKKNAWMLLEVLRTEGARDEDIVGTLFWRIKTMLLAKECGSAEEAGLKPFVYTSAKRLLQEQTKEDLQKKMDDLIVLRHETWRNSGDIGVALECLVLSGKKK